jgi:hypothetical protein
VGGKWRRRRDDALQREARREEEEPAEPASYPRRAPEMSDHHGVSDSHGHLREVGGNKRRSDSKRCANLGANWGKGG